MNDYPDSRYPNSISYNVGGLNVSESSTLSSGPVRFRRSNSLSGHSITLRYSDLTQTEVSEFRQHYLDAAGTHSKFKIPTTVFGGANVTQSTSFYRYASTPDENQKGVFHDIEIEVLVLTGVDLTYVLTAENASTVATESTVTDSFFLNGTGPFILDCDDATPHAGTTLEYLIVAGNANGI
tara:strand:+ start:48 stop:590 length:543 start_codon:yes stop_codon:yes gene_type:complete